MAGGVWKGVYPWVFGCSKQLLQNKFFDPSTPFVRKGCDGEKKMERISCCQSTARTPTDWNADCSCKNISFTICVEMQW